MSNLPRDLTEEVLSKLPLTSLRRVRSTCKNWNNLSKDWSFAKKHLGGQAKLAAREREFMVVMMLDFRVYLMSVNLDNNDLVESCIKPQAQPISLDDEVDDVSQVFHCDGLLLCITDNTSLMVWNPYWGQIRLIEPTHNFHKLGRYSYALGYDKSSKSYKILILIGYAYCFIELKVYNFYSDSWKVLDATPDWEIFFSDYGVSLKGNTYWFATKKYSETRETDESYLVCFDFTSETFGPPLPLPFELNESVETVSLSIVREEQLVLLYQPWDTSQMEIWITTKIEPNAVSWNIKVFLTANIQQLIGPQFHFTNVSFFIDEEKKVAVVYVKGKYIECRNTSNTIAYIFGVDGSLKEVDLGESASIHCYPRVCSYVPSLVQLN